MKRKTELERLYMYNFFVVFTVESFSAEVELLLTGQYSELISDQRLSLKMFCLAV